VPIFSLAAASAAFADCKLTGSNLARPVDDLPSMLIGCDFFLSHHIMVLFKEHKVLFTYNGGPIFQTVAQGPPAPEPTPSADSQ